MDDFAKFQPHQTEDDKIVITFGVQGCVCGSSFSGPFNYVFVFSFTLWFLN